MPARVLVGVVADDGDPRDGRVEASLEPAGPRAKLVDRAVEAVDPPLERDGEVDEVPASAPEQRTLRTAHAAQPHVQGHGYHDGAGRDCAARDRDPAGDRGAHGYPLEERLKKTGYVALLLATR